MEGQRKPREVAGKSQETQEMSQEPQETCNNLSKTFRTSNPSETEAHGKLPEQLREGRKKPKEVPGSPGKTQET
jgi:hypothetical protein